MVRLARFPAPAAVLLKAGVIPLLASMLPQQPATRRAGLPVVALPQPPTLVPQVWNWVDG